MANKEKNQFTNDIDSIFQVNVKYYGNSSFVLFSVGCGVIGEYRRKQIPSLYGIPVITILTSVVSQKIYKKIIFLNKGV